MAQAVIRKSQEIQLGLHNISLLTAQCRYKWRAIHVAGTNGKGSICAYISGMLDAYNMSDYRKKTGFPEVTHGRFTSPHLVHRRDSVLINQTPISAHDFNAIEQRVLKRNDNDGKTIGASEFEILTATAFDAFSHFKLDVAVVEVGVGGRLDATNILGQPATPETDQCLERHAKPHRPLPLVTAISKIGMDHQGLLGNTIEEIAQEKAGIIKPGVPVVYDLSNNQSVRAVIKQRAAEVGSQCLYLRPCDPPSVLTTDRAGEDSAEESQYIMEDLFTSAGSELREKPQHMQCNFSVAFRSTWAALHMMGRFSTKFVFLSSELGDLMARMAAVPETTVIPGRQELLDISSLTGLKVSVLLDGAHNAQSAQILAQRVRAVRSETNIPVTWVLAASDSKDVEEILRPLLREGDSVFCVEFGPVDAMPWVKPMEALKIMSVAESIVPNLAFKKVCGTDVQLALQAASDHCASKDSLSNMVVAGSLYLVGNVHKLLADQRADRHSNAQNEASCAG